MTVTPPSNYRGPYVDLALPASSNALEIVLRNATTGKTLTLNLPAEWAGDDLTLDFYRKTIKDQTGADRSALLDSEDNDLWSTAPLIAGVNDLEIEVIPGVLSSGPKSPGTAADDATTGTVAWSNASNAKASDGSYAKATMLAGTKSHYLKLTNYGFAIPAGATILGIKPEMERRASNGAVDDNSLKIVKGGVISGTDHASADEWFNGAGDEKVSAGGATDLWGLAWTLADINASTFGLALSAHNGASGSREAEVDHIPITVYYRPGAAAYGATATLRWERGYY